MIKKQAVLNDYLKFRNDTYFDTKVFYENEGVSILVASMAQKHSLHITMCVYF